MKFTPAALVSVALAASVLPSGVLGYVPATPVFGSSNRLQQQQRAAISTTRHLSTTSSNDAQLVSMAKSMDKKEGKKQSPEKNASEEEQTWQACVEELLDPSTSLPRRQALLAKLVNANKDIQESVLTALRDRKVGFQCEINQFAVAS